MACTAVVLHTYTGLQRNISLHGALLPNPDEQHTRPKPNDDGCEILWVCRLVEGDYSKLQTKGRC